MLSLHMIVDRVVKLLLLLLGYLGNSVLFVRKTAQPPISIVMMLKFVQFEQVVTLCFHHRPKLLLFQQTSLFLVITNVGKVNY